MATYYINQDSGNDTTGNGSLATPWQTMSKAHTSSATGDTIIMMPSVNVYTFPSLTIGKSLTWRAAIIGDAIIDGTAGAASWTTGIYSLTLENLIFQNVTTNALGMFYMSGTGTRDLLFKNCIFRDIVLGVNNNNSSIILNLAPASKITQNVDLIACSFENITTPYSGIDSQIATIANNSSANGSEINFSMVNCGIYMPAATYQLKNIVQHVYPASGDALTIDNTIIDNMSGATVRFMQSYGNVTYQRVINSTFQNITSPPTTFTNNLYNISTNPTGTNYTSGLLYADVASGDYRLQPDSVGAFQGKLI